MKRTVQVGAVCTALLCAVPCTHGGYSIISITRTWEVGSASIGGIQQQTLTTLDPVTQTYQATPFNPTSMTTGLATASQTSSVGATMWNFAGQARATWNSATSQPPPTISAMTEMRVVFSVDALTEVSAYGLGNGGVAMQNAAFGAVLSHDGGGTIFTTVGGEPPPLVRATLEPGAYLWRVYVQAQTATGGAGFSIMNADFFIPNPTGAGVVIMAGAFGLLRRRVRAS